MNSKLFSRQNLCSGTAILIYLTLAKLLIHLLTARNYGYFGDELYYLAAAKHLDFGYVDIPPLIPLLMAVSRWMIGDSQFAIHILPALAGAVMVFSGGLIARELGGGRFAQGLTALIIIVVPFWLAFNSWFAYDPFDQLFVIFFFYLLIFIIKQETLGRWMLLGVIVGIGLMIKLSMVFLGFGLVIALLATSRRKSFGAIGPWLAALIAMAICTPYLIWQNVHGWPLLTYWRNYGLYRPHLEFGQFLQEQILYLNPFTFPIWILGLWYILFHREGKQYRVLGLIYLALFILFAGIMKLESRMLASCYFPLLAAGAVFVEKFGATPARKKVWNRLKPLYCGLLLTSFILLAPYTLPVIPAPALTKYLNGAINSAATINGDSSIPFVFAYRIGWPELVKEIADVYHHLPEAERKKCVIYAYNYAEAGAINFFGKTYGLPEAISNHLSFHIWGPGEMNPEVMIAFGKGTPFITFPPLEKRLTVLFNEVTLVGFIRGDKYSAPFEKNLPVFICRKPKTSLQETWPQFQNFY